MVDKLNWKDFNEMSHGSLCKIEGIGKIVATRIIANRPFRKNSDLFKIRGLGQRTLNNIGIHREKKERKKWVLMPDGIEYPESCLAIDTQTNKKDFFWRIPKERRQYL